MQINQFHFENFYLKFCVEIRQNKYLTAKESMRNLIKYFTLIWFGECDILLAFWLKTSVVCRRFLTVNAAHQI